MIRLNCGMKQRTKVDLLTDPIDSSLRRFATPLALSFLVNMLYSLVDRFYASRLGDAAIAAIGTSDQITFLLFTFASGFGLGSGIIVARRFGEGDSTTAGRVAAQAIVGMGILSTLITVAIFVFLDQIPHWMNMDPQVAPLATQYMSYLYLGFMSNLVSFQLFAIMRSVGNSVFPMQVMIVTTTINAVVAPFLIFGLGPFPRLEMAGAGLSTAIAQTLGMTVALWAVLNGRTSIKVDFSGYRIDLSLLWRVAKLGLPATFQMLSVALNRFAIFKIVGVYGTTVVAAYTLGITLEMVVFMSIFALGASVEVATGQNLGAKNPERVKGYHRSGMKQGGSLMLVLGILVWIFGEYFAMIYTSSPDTISTAVDYLQITAFSYVFFAIGVVTIRVISGAGATLTSLAITAGSMLLIQLPTAYILSHELEMGPTGVWWGILIGYVVFCAVALTAFRLSNWRDKKV